MNQKEGDLLGRLFHPNWQQAEIHGKASRVGRSHQNQGKCQCCHESIEKEPIPLFQNTKQLQFLGFGFPLYYAFVRNCIFLLLVTICSYNLVATYESVYVSLNACQPKQTSTPSANHMFVHSSQGQNLTGHLDKIRHFQHSNQQESEAQNTGSSGKNQEQQKNLQCQSIFIMFSRNHKQVQHFQILLRTGSFAIHLILLIYIRDKMQKLKQYFDQRNTSLSDYSTILTNLPALDHPFHKILQKLNKQYKINSSIAQIILIPHFQKLEKLRQEKGIILEKMRKKVKSEIQDQEFFNLKMQMEGLEQQIQVYLGAEKEKYLRDQVHAIAAIVILNTEPEKFELLDKFQENSLTGQGWDRVRIKEAPEPKQIIWKNLHIPESRRFFLVCLGWILSLLILVGLTILFALISRKKAILIQQKIHKYRSNKDQISSFYQCLGIVIGMIFFIVMFNKLIMANLFHVFTDYQRHISTYKFQFSFCLKYCLGLFFTTALMTLVVQGFIMGNYQGDYGVIEEESFMFLVNSLFVPLYWAIHPFYVANRIKKYLNKGKPYFTQEQANKIQQLPAYEVGKGYAQVLQIMWFTYLYISLLPIGGIISCLGIVLYYWIDKYNLLNRSSIQNNISGNLISLTISMLDFTLVLRSLGQILFDTQMRSGSMNVSWVMLIIALLYQILPMQWLIGLFNQEKFNIDANTYMDFRSKFEYHYYQYLMVQVGEDQRLRLLNNLKIQ